MLRSLSDWQRIQALCLCSEVRNPWQYEVLVARGIADAQGYLAQKQVLIPSIDDISMVHQLCFCKVHPWAGEIRRFGEEVSVGGANCALSFEIIDRLEVLRSNTKSSLFTADSAQEKIKWFSFYHIGFEMVHPFQDGNGRVGRVILSNQLNMTLKDNKRTIVDRKKYIEALVHGREHKDTGRLAQLVIESRFSAKELQVRKEQLKANAIEI